MRKWSNRNRYPTSGSVNWCEQLGKTVGCLPVKLKTHPVSQQFLSRDGTGHTCPISTWAELHSSFVHSQGLPAGSMYEDLCRGSETRREKNAYCKRKWSHWVASNSLWPQWAVACQTALSIGLYRQGYWSGLPFYFPEDLPDPGIETGSRTAGRPFTVSHREAYCKSHW